MVINRQAAPARGCVPLPGAGITRTGPAVFLGYLQAINNEKEQAVFYHTLLSNCTTVIWAHAQVNPLAIKLADVEDFSQRIRAGQPAAESITPTQ